MRVVSAQARSKSPSSPPEIIHRSLSTFDDFLMSIDGEFVTVKFGPGSYTPVFTKRARTSLTFDATTSFLIGEPSSFA